MPQRRSFPAVRLPGDHAIGDDGPDSGTAALEDAFRPHVHACIAPRIAADRDRLRCSDKELKEMAALITAIKIAEGSTPKAAAAAGGRIAREMRDPPDLTPEEEAQVVDEFVREETTALVRFLVGALAVLEFQTGGLDAGHLGDDLLPPDYPVDEHRCRDFIYLGPDDVRAVLRSAAGVSRSVLVVEVLRCVRAERRAN